MLNYTTIGEITLKTPVCGVNEIPALLCGVIKPKVLQNLILSLVTQSMKRLEIIKYCQM